MTREELEHIIRASGNITNQYEFVILGSQSILGAIPNPPAFFTMSAEADIYPLADPELADQIDGAIGEGSDFQLSVRLVDGVTCRALRRTNVLVHSKTNAFLSHAHGVIR